MYKYNFLTKRPILVVVLALIAHLGMSAAYQLDIHKTNGMVESFRLENRPVMTFNETDMLITVDGTTIAIARDDIKNLDFSECAGVIAPTEDKDNIIEVIDANTLRINAKDVAVYDISGRSVSAASIANDGDCTVVSLASCPAGVYIITYNKSSIKITKK